MLVEEKVENFLEANYQGIDNYVYRPKLKTLSGLADYDQENPNAKHPAEKINMIEDHFLLHPLPFKLLYALKIFVTKGNFDDRSEKINEGCKKFVNKRSASDRPKAEKLVLNLKRLVALFALIEISIDHLEVSNTRSVLFAIVNEPPTANSRWIDRDEAITMALPSNANSTRGNSTNMLLPNT